MKAVVYKEPNQPLIVEEIEVPRAGPNELILNVKAVGICGSDLHGTMKSSVMGYSQDIAIGHEFCGAVAELGENTQSMFSVGDRVTSMPLYICGQCENCKTGTKQCENLQLCGIRAHGACAEKVKVGAFTTFKLADNVSDELGALIEPLAVAYHSFKQMSEKPIDSVLILGAGPIGTFIALWAKHFSVKNIIVADVNPKRLQFVEKIAATAVIDITENENVGGEFKKITGAKPNYIYEATGAKGVLSESINYAGNYAKIISLGVGMQDETITPAFATLKNITIQFVLGYTPESFIEVVNLVSKLDIPVDDIVTSRLSLDEVPKKFEKLRGRHDECKVLIFPS